MKGGHMKSAFPSGTFAHSNWTYDLLRLNYSVLRATEIAETVRK